MPSREFIAARAEHLRAIGREDLIDAPPLVKYDESGFFDAQATKHARDEHELAQWDREHAA